MNERHNKKSSDKTRKKDMYSHLLICQILAVCFLMLCFYLTVRGNEVSYSQLKDILSRELFTAEDIISDVKTYFFDNKSWAVSGDKAVYLPSQSEFSEGTGESLPDTAQETNGGEAHTDEALSGVGGEDVKLYEATGITSFAPIKTTSPAVSPIEKGRYTSYFGYRINPITGEFSFHTGLDIAAPEGTKIRAAYSGEVTRVGEDSRVGKYIFVTHDDGLVTFYCHCSEILAQEGAVLRQGETVARVGSTGWSTGPHLHFEVRKDNIRYNPLFILER